MSLITKVRIGRPYVFSIFFFFKQKTAYEMRISDWSSDVCSSELGYEAGTADGLMGRRTSSAIVAFQRDMVFTQDGQPGRSEEHTYALQSRMRNSYVVFCLQNKNEYDCMLLTSLIYEHDSLFLQ